MSRIEIDFPWPAHGLNPNKPIHYMKKSKLRAQQKSDAFYIAKKYGVPEFIGNIPVKFVFCPPNNTRRDLDNLLASVKGLADGVALAWGVDDSRFRPITIDFGEKTKSGCVRLIVE